jgi:hypothetical protein
MTIILCLLAMIALFLLAVLASREVIGRSPLRLSWALHALSALLILLAISTRGIWYKAETYLGDFWTAQEAIHKTAQGLHSSLDYFSPIGPVMEWLYVLTLFVQPPAASSVVLANVCVAIVALLLTVLLLHRRASPLAIAITGLIAVTTALTPRDIDSLITAAESSMLAPYNRWGWALLVPVAMRGALPIARVDLLGGLLIGAVIALLLLLKVTYGLAAIGIFMVALVLQPTRWREFGAVAVSLLLCLAVVDLATGGQLRAYLNDLALTAQMPSNGVRIPKLFSGLPVFVAFAFGSLLLQLAATRDDTQSAIGPLIKNWRPLLLALAVGGSGLVVLMQNHYYTEATTLLLMPLIVAEWTGLTVMGTAAAPGIWKRGGEWIGALLLVTLALPAIDAGFILAQKVQTMRKAAPAQFAGTEFRDLVIDETHLPTADGQCASSTCRDVRRMLTGRELLQRLCPAYRQRAVLALNFSNPFPALLGAPSPRHAPIWLHSDRSFSAAAHVPGETLLADVGCVMIAKNESNAAALAAIYNADLRRAFQRAGQNAQWQLWVRK